MEQSKLIKDLIDRVDELGMTVVVDGSEIEISGSEDRVDEQEMVADVLMEHKDEVINFIKTKAKERVHKEHKPMIEELKEKLRKGVEWFVAVDRKLWEKLNVSYDDPEDQSMFLSSRTKLERTFIGYMSQWIEYQKVLRNLYHYDDCIFEDGSCPMDSPVKCDGCR